LKTTTYYILITIKAVININIDLTYSDVKRNNKTVKTLTQAN